jgi:hypothetical protein
MDVRIILLTANESAAVRHNLYSFGDVIAGAVETTAFQARFRGILERHSRENQRRVRVASSAHPVSSHVLAELHDPETGRLDAGRIASFLGTPLSNLAKFSQVSVAGLHKSPRSVSVQPHLIPIARSLAILTQLLSSKESVLAWMNSPHPDLGGETPLTLILQGKAQVVADLLEAALAGQPSKFFLKGSSCRIAEDRAGSDPRTVQPYRSAALSVSKSGDCSPCQTATALGSWKQTIRRTLYSQEFL